MIDETGRSARRGWQRLRQRPRAATWAMGRLVVPRHRARPCLRRSTPTRRSAATSDGRRCSVGVACPEHDWDAAQAAPDPAPPARSAPSACASADVDRAALALNTFEPHPAAPGRWPVRACPSCTRSRRPASTSWSTASTSCRGASTPAEIEAAAMANLAAWSASADWTDEELGPRRLPRRTTATGRTPHGSCCPRSAPISPAALRPGGRPILVGLPDRHLLVAGVSSAGDAEFGRSSWPASWPTMPTAPTSRSTDACSSWSATSCDRWPADRRMAARTFEALRWEVDSGVATITLDRPAALNSLEATLKARPAGGPARGRPRPDRPGRHPDRRRPGVLRRPGPQGAARSRIRRPLDVEVRERFNPLVQAIRVLDKPVIARGQRGGRRRRAPRSPSPATCGSRPRTASFVLAFGRIGLIPDSGATWLLPRLVGLGRATELMLLPDPIRRAEALRIGLVEPGRARPTSWPARRPAIAGRPRWPQLRRERWP